MPQPMIRPVDPQDQSLVLATHLMRESLVLLDEIGAARAATYLQLALDLLEGPMVDDSTGQRH